MVSIYEWLFASLFWLGALLFVIGCLLLVCPAALLKRSAYLNHWISTEPVFDRLDDRIHVERYFYRHHRWMGGGIVVGAVYCLYSLLDWVRYDRVIGHLIHQADQTITDIVLDSALLILGLGNLMALLVGIIVFLRPSLLKSLERWSNTWMAFDRVTETLDRQIDITERWLPRHPRLIGLLAVIGSVYIMSNTVVVVLG